MKKIPNEPFEEYVKRVRIHEYGIALQALANGNDPALVAAAMSMRIMDKVLHPLYKKLNNPD